MRKMILYHVLFWIAVFISANLGVLFWHQDVSWPFFLYKNISSFVLFYILWGLGIMYNRRVNRYMRKSLSGMDAVKYSILNWPFFTALAVVVGYIFLGFAVDAAYLTAVTPGELFEKKNENYQLRLDFAVFSAIIAYLFTWEAYAKKKAKREYVINLKKKLKAVEKDEKKDPNEHFNLN